MIKLQPYVEPKAVPIELTLRNVIMDLSTLNEQEEADWTLIQ